MSGVLEKKLEDLNRLRVFLKLKKKKNKKSKNGGKITSKINL